MTARFVKIAALATVAVAGVALAKPAARNWAAAVSYLPSGAFAKGNPAAPVKLVEYISYTCSHCAHFNGEAGATLSASYVATGRVQVEVRPFFLNMFDIPASLLAHCGPASRFQGNHDALLAQQGQWLPRAQNPDEARIKRWSDPDFAKRMKAVAADLGIDRIMLARGYTRAQLDQCLADKPLAQKLADLTTQGVQTYKVQGTPGFLIDNQLQVDTHSWAALRPKLDAALR